MGWPSEVQVREDEYAEAVQRGRDNAEAIEFVRRHCRHARVEMPDGNSMVGSMCGIPMGRLEVRCEYAPPPRTSGHRALDLAAEFYRDNCIGCPHRLGTGELPNLATIVAERDQAEELKRQTAQRTAQELARRHEQRRQRRRQSVAGEGYVVRDLAGWLDRLDADAPRDRPLDAAEREAARQLIEAARHAPQLFSPQLVTSLLDLAVDTAEPHAFTAVIDLVRADRCDSRAAVEATLAVLPGHRVPEAARILSVFRDQLRAEDLPPVLDRLVELAARRDNPWRRLPPQPDGLRAAAAIDLTAVTAHLITRLGSDDEWTRADAADACTVLLTDEPNRIIVLGPALVASIRGEDTHYLGDPSPSTSATRALAEAWRGEPDTTVSIIESGAASLPAEARPELVRTVWFLKRWREPFDLTDAAADAAVAFCVRRLGGGWGSRAADRAADELERLARDAPTRTLRYVDALLGELLVLSAAPEPSPLTVPTRPGVPAELAALDRMNTAVSRNARRYKIARTVGQLVGAASADVLPRVLALFETDSGDQVRDREVRVALLTVLEQAATGRLLRDLLPVAYSALLGADQVVRAAAVRLWAACVRVAEDAIPDELAELAEALLTDRYVIVHRAMLDHLPQLRLPARLAPRLLPIVATWAHAYIDDPDVLEDALWALRCLADKLDDQRQALGWHSHALSLVHRLRPHHREWMLTSSWPPPLRAHPAWSRAALGALASRELADYFNVRNDPLLEALLDQPAPLAEAPLDEVAAVTEVHLPAHPWRALEPVELLQTVGRWAEAHTLAERVVAAAPPGAEGADHRALAQFVEAVTRLDEHLTDDRPIDTAALTGAARAVQDAAAALAEPWQLSDDKPDRRGRRFIDAVTARVDAALALLAPATADPIATAAVLDAAAQRLESAPGGPGAPAAQRRRVAAAWRVAATLHRYDSAVRAADADSSRFLRAAQRQAQILTAEINAAPEIPVPAALAQFCAAVERLASASGISAANADLVRVAAPTALIDLPDGARHLPDVAADDAEGEKSSLAVCVASLAGAPITDVLVVRPNELYTIEMTVRLPTWPDWAQRCYVEPVTTLSRSALSLPVFVFHASDATTDDAGILLSTAQPLHCAVEQPIRSPAIDCPLVVRFTGDEREERITVAGYRRLRLRPFDPSKDKLTEHEQTDARLLAMFDTLADPGFDTEDVRAFCRLFGACVRAAQSIMFDKVFRRGTRVSETMFHKELEARLKTDPELGGRLTRRDAVAGGFDDLLHDEVIAELKVARSKAITINDCATYLGQPTQYGIDRGSQLSVLVVLDHSPKHIPPGVIENYVGWLKPKLHGLHDPRYPSLVGVLIINTNLPVPSAWSRKRIDTIPMDQSGGDTVA